MQVDATKVHVDATKVQVDATKVHVDATKVHVDATKVHVDATKVHVDATKVHVDATKVHVDATKVHVDATKVQDKRLVLILARLKIFVGWVEALRNPTNPTKCWISFLNPTYPYCKYFCTPIYPSLQEDRL